MSKPNSARISFAGLKNDRNKQNDLCFQNLKTNPAESSFTSNGHYQSNYNKNISMPLQRKISDDPQNLFTSARFANAIKQINKGNHSRRKNHSSVQQAYERAQRSIRQQIQQYNNRFSEVSEMLADLHIKDLMKFNQCLQKNQMLYQRYIDEDLTIGEKKIFNEANIQDLRKIKQVQKAVVQIINDKSKSFDFRSTFESKQNNKTISGNSSRVLPQPVLQINSPFKATKKSSPNFDKIVQSIRSQVIKNSGSSKIDSFEQGRKRGQQILQDTPESVKSKISFTTSKIKTQKNVGIGMFDRINVCQSIEHFQPLQNECDPLQNQSYRPKRDHRYGRSSQQ